MGNVDARFGLKPVRYLNGAPYNGAAIRCYVSSLYATALFIGDPVSKNTALTDLDPTAKHITVMKAADGDGDDILGVIVGFDPNPDDLTQNYIPASTGGYAYVCVDDRVVYQIRDDASATGTVNFPGSCGNLVYTHAGDTATGLSGVELLASTVTTTNTFQVYILGLSDIPDNALSTRAIWDVIINQSQLGNRLALGVTAS